MKFSQGVQSIKVQVFLISFLLPTLMTAEGLAASRLDLLKLVNQVQRPSVQQIEQYLKNSTPLPELQSETSLPKDSQKPRNDLQNNFPIWYTVLIQGAPQMIASFEKAFPGATWAFIGRDMAILADVFEAFYRSIGQTDRVARIGMSRGTLDGLTGELAMGLLESQGLELKEGMHPFILIDAVSRGGGRQGRYLLNAVYGALAQGHKWPSLSWTSSDLLPYFNFIGLRVSTTAIPHRDALQAQKLIEKDQDQNFIDFDHYTIFTYTDGNVTQEFIGTNEAGYTHWTGSWHGSYGPVIQTGQGRVLAQVGSLALEEVREATIRFQAYVVRAAQSPQFFINVKNEASKLGYSFPTMRESAENKYFLLKKLLEDVHTSEGMRHFILELKNTRLTSHRQTQLLKDLTIQVNLLMAKADLTTLDDLLEMNEQFGLINLNKKEFEAVYLARMMSPNEKMDFDAVLKVMDPSSFSNSFKAKLSKHPTVFKLALSLVQSDDEMNRLLKLVRNSLSSGQRDYLVANSDLILKFNLDKASLIRLLNIFPEEKRKLILDSVLDFYFELHPDIHDMNRLISSIKQNSLSHYRIAERALGQLTTRAEYKALRKPSHKNLTHSQESLRYGHARVAFKKKHPKQSWFSFFRKSS